MPPRVITLKKQETLQLSVQDAEAINEVLLRFTTEEQPDAALTRACEQVKDAWLAAFREAVITKVEQHCVNDDSIVEATMGVNDDGAFGALSRACDFQFSAARPSC